MTAEDVMRSWNDHELRDGYTQKYVVREIGDNNCDVVHIGPYTVSKGLKLQEALALAAALNMENKDR